MLEVEDDVVSEALERVRVLCRLVGLAQGLPDFLEGRFFEEGEDLEEL